MTKSIKQFYAKTLAGFPAAQQRTGMQKPTRIAPICQTQDKQQNLDKHLIERMGLLALSLTLTIALIYVGTIIGASLANAAPLQPVHGATAIEVKQTSTVGGFAIGSVSVIALGALLFLTKPSKPRKK